MQGGRGVIFPVQMQRNALVVSESVQAAAYEVYKHVHGPQESLLNPATCRGGFSSTELMAYLYASGYPKNEWRERADFIFASVKRAEK